MTSFFITGANGFIGRALSDHLRAAGHDVSGVDLRPDAERGIIAGDTRHPESFAQSIPEGAIVVHTAALVSNAVPMETAWEVSALATRDLIDVCRDRHVSRFVYISSIRAFSDLHYPDHTDETRPVYPDGNSYVDVRIAAEHSVLAAHANGTIEATIVRPGDVYGPGCRPWVIIPVEKIKSGIFMLPDHGNGKFCPTYIDDLVRGIELAALKPEAAGNIFTITGGHEVPCKEYFGHFYQMLGKKPRLVPTWVAVGAATVVEKGCRLLKKPTEVNATSMWFFTKKSGLSIDKARRMLGYEPQVSLSEGMEHVERWLNDNHYLDKA